MYLILLLFWVLLNGRITIEILLFGVVIAALLFAFICKFMDYSIQKEWLLLKSAGLLFSFFGVLLGEIAKANFSVLHLILSPKMSPEPSIVYFKTNLKSGLAKVLLANSISLTPGTITVSVVDDVYCIHCLDKSFGEGLEDSVFVQMLTKLEEGWKS